jgi:hypothetical protein
MPEGDPTAALRQALNALLDVTPVDRQRLVLRRALSALISDTPGTRTVNSRKDHEGWQTIRARVRQEIERRGLSTRDLAVAADLSLSAAQKVSAVHGPTPSSETIHRIEAWLANLAPRREVPKPEVRQPAVASGAWREPSMPAPLAHMLASPANGAASPTAIRLGDGDRQRLADLTEQMNDRELRARIGVSQEDLDRVIINRPVPAATIERCRVFLEGSRLGVSEKNGPAPT